MPFTVPGVHQSNRNRKVLFSHRNRKFSQTGVHQTFPLLNRSLADEKNARTLTRPQTQFYVTTEGVSTYKSREAQ